MQPSEAALFIKIVMSSVCACGIVLLIIQSKQQNTIKKSFKLPKNIMTKLAPRGQYNPTIELSQKKLLEKTDCVLKTFGDTNKNER